MVKALDWYSRDRRFESRNTNMEIEIKRMVGNKAKFNKIVKEYKDASSYEIWEGVRDNFIFGFIAATLVVFIATKTDLAVLIGYLTYYFFMGKIVNRPKYVTC